MSDLDPSLAKKVLTAEVRNLVKKVGDGGTLSGTDRQVFLALTEGSATPDEIREARIVALLRKWMDGGRLSHAERDEIAHMLPEATAVSTEETPLPQRPGALVEAEILEIYGISRAKYFRWKKQGQEVAEGPDLPPFDDPKAMVAWYERMRLRGIFSHQCPKTLKDLALKGLPQLGARQPAAKQASPAPSKSAPAAAGESAPPPPSGNHTAQVVVPEEDRGFIVEHEKLEAHTAILRRDYLQAYADGKTDEGNALKSQYFEAYDRLLKSSQQKATITLAEGSQVKVTDVAEVLGSFIPAIARTLISPQHFRSIYDELGLADLGMEYAAFEATLRARTLGAFASLRDCRFAPPLILA